MLGFKLLSVIIPNSSFGLIDIYYGRLELFLLVHSGNLHRFSSQEDLQQEDPAWMLIFSLALQLLNRDAT